MAIIDLHSGILTSPKFVPLSDGAMRLWLHAVLWSKEHLTDGFIPAATLPVLHPRARQVVVELLTSPVPGKGPLWHEVTGGYLIHDYEEWQETKERVQNRRRQWRRRQESHRHGRADGAGGENTPIQSSQSVTGNVTQSVTQSVTRDSRVSHADVPSTSPSICIQGGGAGGGWGTLPVRPRPWLVHESAIGVDVTERMHQQYLAQLENVRVPDADAVLRAFYHRTEQAWRGKPTGKAWPFWDARVEELVRTTHRPASALPFAWTCKHCRQVHEVARRELFDTFRCPSLEVA